MSDYRRYYVAGGTYFFTVKTDRNAPIFAEITNVRLLGKVIREMVSQWPCEINAMVLLPDHLHSIWSLPSGDSNYSTRWAWIKSEFTRRYLESGGKEQSRSESRSRNRRRGVWQRRYWEHMIRDEEEYDAYFDYVHWNPVKHGHVQCPVDWPHSSFHRWVNQGVYLSQWGCGQTVPNRIGTVLNAGE